MKRIQRPLFLAGFVYLAGVTAAVFCPFSRWLALFFLLLTLVFWLFAGKRAAVLALVSFSLALACLSAALWSWRSASVLALDGQSLTAEGLITASSPFSGGVRYEAELELNGRKVDVQLSSFSDDWLEPGQRFRGEMLLSAREERSRNSGVLLDGIVTGLQDLGPESGWKAYCLRLRGKLSDRIDVRFGDREGELIKAIFLGERTGLSAETTRIFEKSGVVHLLTVSGLHLSLMAEAVFDLIWLLGFDIKTCSLLTLPFLILAAGVEGMTLAVSRALIMCLLRFSALVLQRDYDGLNAWGLALILVLFPAPVRVFIAGFLLSFSASLGIYLFAPLIRRWIFRRIVIPKIYTLPNHLLYRMIGAFSAGVGANLLMAPFLLYFTGFYPFCALLTGPVVALLLPLLLGLTGAALLLPAGKLCFQLVMLAQGLFRLFFRILQALAELNWVFYGQDAAVLAFFAFLYGLMALLFWTKANKKQVFRTLGAYVALAFLLCGALFSSRPAAVELTACRTALVLVRNRRAVIVGQMNSPRDVEEVEKVLLLSRTQGVDLLYLTAQPKDLSSFWDFAGRWRPLLTMGPKEPAGFDRLELSFQTGEGQLVRFWNSWTLREEGEGVLLSDGKRKLLKIPEKYAIINVYDQFGEANAVLGDEYLAWGDASLWWTRTWDGQLKAVIPEEEQGEKG